MDLERLLIFESGNFFRMTMTLNPLFTRIRILKTRFFARKYMYSMWILEKQVGNPTSTTSQLKTRDSKDSARA
jgi:hypothetical protein